MKKECEIMFNEEGYEYDDKTGIITILKSGTYEFANGKLVKLEKGDKVSEDGVIHSGGDKK